MTLPLTVKVDRLTQKRAKLAEKVTEISKQIRLLDLELTYLSQISLLEKAEIPNYSPPLLAEPTRPEGFGQGVPLPVPKPVGDCSSCSDGVTRLIRRTLGNGKTVSLRVCGDCGNENII